MTTLIPKYDQGSTGAVNRPFNEKLQEYVSVFDFMSEAQIAAVEAHTATDVTAEIQAAFNSGADSVYFPFGLYPVTSTLTIPTSMRIYGNGYKFSSLTEGAFIYGIGAFILLDVAARDCSIEGLAFQSGGTGANANTALIYPTLANVGDVATYNLNITRCYFEGGNSQINMAFNAGGSIIYNCQFAANADTTYGIVIVQNTTLGGGNPIQNYIDLNAFNSVAGVTNAGSAAIYLDSVDTHFITRNNIFQSWKYGVLIAQTKTYPNNLININNNNIESIKSSAITMTNAGNVWICNNELVGELAGTANVAIFATNCGTLFIDNNLMQGYREDGLALYGCTRATITNNKIQDIGIATTDTYSNILLSNSFAVNISGNLLAGGENQASRPLAYINATSTSSYVNISNNWYNRTTGAIPTNLLRINNSTNVVATDYVYPQAPPFNSTYNSGAINLSVSSNSVAASSGTLNLTIPINTIYGSTGTFAGIVAVSNIDNSFFSTNTTAVYSVSGRGTTATFTSLNSTNGSTAGASFTLAMSANGVITMTNTHGAITNATLAFTGIAGAGS
jgi:hypothetical protein